MVSARISRRELLELSARYGLLVGSSSLFPLPAEAARLLGFGDSGPRSSPALAELLKQAPVARYWISSEAADVACSACHSPLELGEEARHEHRPAGVRCLLCAHQCLLADGERGRCRARINVNGELRSLVYGRPISEHVDPIEKKPFYHFLPGSEAFSIATSGCPLRCRFCQNWEISQASPEDYHVPFRSADAMAARASERRTRVIAFTYNEPTVFVEYLCDIARAARDRGLRPVLVSCGFMTEAPLREMIEVLDAIKIDLKGFSPDFYRDVSGAELEPVLRSIRQVARAGRHLEIVNLVVPTLNDSEKMLTELAKWIAGEAGPDVPVHFTRFHPDYQLQNLPPTPVETLERAREIALRAGLRFPYVGNVPGHPGNHTYCPECGEVCVERTGFFVTSVRLEHGACPACGTKIAGIWE